MRSVVAGEKCRVGKANALNYLERRGERKGLCIAGRRNIFQPKEARMTTDLVCGMDVDEKQTKFQTAFAGKKYYFCSDECRKEFENRPEEYMESAAA